MGMHCVFGAVSECAFGPHAALAKKPEMLMYNMYTPLSELFGRLACRPNPSF